MFILELFVVLPWIVSKEENYSFLLWFLHVSMGCLLYFNSLLTFWKTISTDPSIRNVMLPSILKPGNSFVVTDYKVHLAGHLCLIPDFAVLVNFHKMPSLFAKLFR